MSSLTVRIPDGLAQKLREYAEAEGLTMDQLISSAAAEKLSALLSVDHLRHRAQRGSEKDMEAFMDKSPNVAPDAEDQLE